MAEIDTTWEDGHNSGLDYTAAPFAKLKAENAALKEQLSKYQADGTTLKVRVAEITVLKEQVAQLEAEDSAVQLLKDKTNNSLSDQLTTLQSKSDVLVDALKAYPDFGEYFMEHLEATYMKKVALAVFQGEK